MSEHIPPHPGGFAAGSRIAGYRLEEQIGRGGMAVVFRALDERLERQVALKILAPALASDEAFRQRFIRESRAAAAVDDPHIIPVFEAGEAGGVLFIAMRYVRGGDVKTLVETDGPLPPRRATELTAQVASALDAAHSRGLVHRDVKPANMLLDARAEAGRPDHVYLSDFGLSKASLAPSGLTGTGQFLGTLDYVSPEQIEGKAVDGRADQYALACSAFEFLCGEPPFLREEGMAVMYAKLSEQPPPLTARRPGLPPAVDAVLARALARPPDERYASCQEFADALGSALRLRPYHADSAAHPAGRSPTEVVRPSPPGGTGQPASWPRADYPGGSGQPPAAWPPADYPAAAGQVTSVPPRPGEAGGGAAPPDYGLPGGPWAPSGGDQQGQPGGGAGPGEAAAGPATRAAWTAPGGSTARVTGPGDWAGTRAGTAVRRSRRAPKALLAAAVVAALAVAGGAYYLVAGRGHGTPAAHGGTGRTGGTGGGQHGSPGNPLAVAGLPGCSTAVARAKTLASVRSSNTPVAGNPFGLLATPDGRFAFATVQQKNVPSQVIVLRHDQGTTLTQVANYNVPGGAKSMVLTSDGRYLLVASGNGLTVLDTAAAEGANPGAVAGSLVTPGVQAGKGGAIQVVLSPDGQFAFVELQYGHGHGSPGFISVFNLALARQSGFKASHLLGEIPLGASPVGLTMSPDHQWLYAMNSGNSETSPTGSIGVISVPKAETDQAHAVVRTVAAACDPARAVISADGTVLWVTAKTSDYLLAYDTAKLSGGDPAHSLLAKVPVGANPIGLVLVKGGNRIIVADSNANGIAPSAGNNLAVIDSAAALGHKPGALLGYIPSGQTPRQFGQLPTGELLVSDNMQAQIQVVDLAQLP